VVRFRRSPEIHRVLIRSAKTLIALTLAAVAAWSTGCASTEPIESAQPAPRDIDFISPALRGAENGLEMHWWVVEGSPEQIREAMARYADADCGVCPATRERLAASGLRLLRAPLTDLAEIRSGLTLRGRTDRKWLGQAPWWIEALRGALVGETLIEQHGRVVTLPSGRLRVLARAWTSPSPEGPRMRADVAVQHLPRISELLPSLTPDDARRTLEPQHQGPIFDETMACLEMQEGYAYLLICDRPGAAWGQSEQPQPDPLEMTYSPLRPAPEELIGPPTAPIPTIGERLLRRAATPLTGDRSMTAVVVLAPRLPERFALLP